jgi:Raf kinase inhibitor-like YbhB/YbcL family protein
MGGMLCDKRFAPARFARSIRMLLAGGIVMFAFAPLSVGSKSMRDSSARPSRQAPTAAFRITSTAFLNGDAMPKKFTCDGANISPFLAWTQPPKGTASFALVLDDPDAPKHTLVHWLIYDLPGDSSGLPENMPTRAGFESDAHQGLNDFKKFGYGGPCPPSGKTHRYFFRLYALDEVMHLNPGVSRRDLDRAISSHILGKAELMVHYQRQ